MQTVRSFERLLLLFSVYGVSSRHVFAAPGLEYLSQSERRQQEMGVCTLARSEKEAQYADLHNYCIWLLRSFLFVNPRRTQTCIGTRHFDCHFRAHLFRMLICSCVQAMASGMSAMADSQQNDLQAAWQREVITHREYFVRWREEDMRFRVSLVRHAHTRCRSDVSLDLHAASCS